MSSKINCLLFINMIIFSAPGLFAWNNEIIKPFIFVDSEDEIPDEFRQRKAYFHVLLDYEKDLVKGLKGYLELIYGDVLGPNYLRRWGSTEALKDDFFSQAEVIQYAGLNMLISDEFSKEELFDYSTMISRHAETFNQIFR